MGAKFSGGIALPHQAEHKEETANLPVQTLAPPQVVIPMAQGLARPALPVVEPGQTVKKGELIGRSDGKCQCRYTRVFPARSLRWNPGPVWRARGCA